MGRRVFSQTPQERNDLVTRPLTSPHSLSHLVGDQACHRQADHTAARAALSRPVVRHCHGRRDRKPKLGVVGGAGERRHGLVEQRTPRVRDRLEHLSVEGAESLGDLPHPTRHARPPHVQLIRCRGRQPKTASTSGSADSSGIFTMAAMPVLRSRRSSPACVIVPVLSARCVGSKVIDARSDVTSFRRGTAPLCG